MQAIPLPHVDIARRFRRQRFPTPIRIQVDDHRQLTLFPPSVLRRVALRRRTVFRYRDIRGEVVTRTLLETVPVVLPTAADDAGLPDVGRWTPPRHTRTFDTAPYLEDYDVRRFVVEHPEGASLGEIAEEIGWTKQGVMEVERRAMAKIVKLAREDESVIQWMADTFGLDVEELEGMLARRAKTSA